MAPYSVLFIERGGEVGGAERVLLDIAGGVDRARFRPVTVCLDDGSLPTQLRALGVPTVVYRVGRLRGLHRVARALIGLVRLVKSEGIDLVHVNGTMMLLYGGPVAWLTRRPLVWHVYDPQRRSGKARRVFVAVASRFRPAWTIFGTVTVEANHREVFPNIGRSSTILPGVDLRASHLVEQDRSVLPPDVPDDAVVILSLARYVPGKGLEDLISAVARLSLPAIHVVLCGGLPVAGYTEELQRRAGRLGVATQVHFMGHVPEATKRTLISTCDIVVHPATFEAFGLAVVEAMAAGKPVVAADAPGPSHTVLDGVTGLLYPRGEVGELEAALSRLVGDPELRQSMGVAGQERAAAFSVDKMVASVEQVWRDVMVTRRS